MLWSVQEKQSSISVSVMIQSDPVLTNTCARNSAGEENIKKDLLL